MMRQIFRWTVVIGVVLGALYYAEAGGGGRKICHQNPTPEPIGYGCRRIDRNPYCAGNCRYYVNPNGQCVQGNKGCKESEELTDVQTFVAPCVVRSIFDPQIQCICGTYMPGPVMRYKIKNCIST